jgi:xylitol oxidase
MTTNWAGNVTFSAATVHQPATVDELRRLVASTPRIRALGTAHSFSRIADGPGDLVAVTGLPKAIVIDPERARVTVAAGVRSGELAVWLNEAGWALHNLASLPHISVAGAVATATHGSGDRNQNLSAKVAALDLVTADGDLVTVSRDDPRFNGMVVGLGALGVVVSLGLDIQPTFQLEQIVYENLPMSQLREQFDAVFGSGYSVSVVTDWRTDRINQVWQKRPAGSTVEIDAPKADGPRNLVPGMSADFCTEQLGVPGPWHERLPHFRLEFTPSAGDELQSEFFVARERAMDAIEAVHAISSVVSPVLHLSEIRTIAADELWLSPHYGRDSVAIHFTWVKDPARVAAALAVVEDTLAPFDVRAHWGKITGLGPEYLRPRYERLLDFEALLADYDPAGKFRNEVIDRYFGGEERS